MKFIFQFVSLFLFVPLGNSIEPILLVHGGAGSIAESTLPTRFIGVKEAIRRGYELLIKNKSSLDAVEEAVRYLEDDPNFNAGYGSVLTEEGEVEMDAAIMNGYDLSAGCVAVVKDIAHPISLARLVMEKSKSVFLAANGTRKFALEQGVEILPPGALIPDKTRETNEDIEESNIPPRFKIPGYDTSNPSVYEYIPGTVGAVAIDIYGNISAATSTGGIRGKPHGRVGDSPILGSGTIANNRIAGVSATGDGEYILRFNLAQQILQRIRYEGKSGQEATEDALNAMKEEVGGSAGAITIDHNGEVGIFFISNQMLWGYRQGNLIRYGANKGQVIEEEADDNDGVSALQSVGVSTAVIPFSLMYKHICNAI
ncbi:unnamed protein product [Hermetia illucens]|uniref:Uncharacterized protein n=1 Tax=Hermetia illucens TaxID=343691 RepID=A0A7R8YZ03_HERIL|nr:probable isoaspartyl peptidase/L-asparaginase GA20639 [Hermetia illucens]CAD7090679.1 unnamed protein product [Hermetia illucens]